MSDQPNARDVIAAALDADPELRDAIANLEPGTPEGDRADAVIVRMFALPGAARAVDRLGVRTGPAWTRAAPASRPPP
jgi:hypothetical protein